MYCGNCGAQIPDGSLVCPVCGMSPTGNVQQPMDNGVNAPAGPVNNGYVQQPMNNGYVQQPVNNGYVQQPMNNGYMQQPMNNGYVQQPQMNNGYAQQPQMNGGYMQPPMNGYAPNAQQPQQPVAGGGLAVTGLLLGIFGTIGAIFGAMAFGIYATSLSSVLCIVGIILSAIAKKKSGKKKGTGGLVFSIIGLVFSMVFTVGCIACGSAFSDAGMDGFGMYGCYGAYWQIDDAIKDSSGYSIDEWSKAFNGDI